MLRIGSFLLQGVFPDYKRVVKDLDYLIEESELKNYRLSLYEEWLSSDRPFFFSPKESKGKVDILVINKNNPIYDTYIDLRKYTSPEYDYKCLRLLFIMKNAHKHFYRGKYKQSFKHLRDYSVLLENLGPLTKEELKISENYRDFLIKFVYDNDPNLLVFPNLNKSKKEFFNDKVTYYVDHDYLHTLVAIEDEPAYLSCTVGEVKFSNKLFHQQTFETKVNMVIEESLVLAIERCLLPMLLGEEETLPAYTSKEAFKYSLVRVATNITSGDFRAFAADNFNFIYEEFLNKHREYYKIIRKLDLEGLDETV